MVSAAVRMPMTPEEFLAFENASPSKHEYVRGEIFAMSGTSSGHNEVVQNIGSLLRGHLRGRRCRTYVENIKLRVEAANAYFYPDVFVTCDPRDRSDTLVKRHAVLIVEVLSESTASYDRGEKFADYRKLESLKEVLLVDSRQQLVDLYRKNEHGIWEILPLEITGSITLESVELTVPVAALYDDTDVSPPGGRNLAEDTSPATRSSR